MSSNTFTEAIEMAYAECWRQGEYLEKIENGEVEFAGGEEGRKRAYDSHWRETIGAAKVLGALLAARGDVGRRTFPDDPSHEALPDAQQTWIRLMQWAIRKGLTTQDKLDEVVEAYPAYTDAMRLLGKDRDLVDFNDRVEGPVVKA